MAASAHDVAAAIRQRIPRLTQLQVHKLLYLAQGFHYAWFGKPLFAESIQAWEHGPVVADVWRAERYGEPPETIEPLDAEGSATVGYVCSRYGHNTGWDLRTLTHNEGPWAEAYYREAGDRDRHTIFGDALEEFFRKVLVADDEEEDFSADPAALARMVDGAEERRLQPAGHDTRESLIARLRG